MSTISAYTGDGSTTQFDITFEYEDAATVRLRVDGTDVDFTFVSASRVQADVAPATGTAVEVYRKTPVAAPAVDFQDGSIIRAADLDKGLTQVRHRTEELDSEAAKYAERALKFPRGEAVADLPGIASRAGKFLGFDGSGTPVALPGTGDEALRADLLQDVGGSRVKAKRNLTNSVARTIAQFLDDTSASIEDFGAVGDWNGATGTDNWLAFERARLSGIRHIRVPQKPYMTSKSIQLGAGQQLVGEGSAMYTHSAATPQSLIAYRPTDGSKVAVRNYIGTNGQGVRGLSLDMNGADHNAIQFYSTYGNRIKDVKLWGTFNWGAVFHDTYVCDIDNLDTCGASFHGGAIYLGIFNAFTIKNVHTSNLPPDPLIKTWGLAAVGGGIGLDVVNLLGQGVTVTAELGNGVADADIRAYHENVVCSLILGTSSGGPTGCRIRGGCTSGPYVDHPQAASAGPHIWAQGGSVILDNVRFNGGVNQASATGPWPVVAGNQLQRISIRDCTIYGDYDAGKILMRETGVSPGYEVTGSFDVLGGYAAAETIRKTDGAYGAAGFRYKYNSSGDLVKTAYTPATIPNPVSALLAQPIPGVFTVLK